MILLATLARKNLFGDPTGDSVFVAFLLGGAVLGAIGGLLGAQSAAGQEAVPPQGAPAPQSTPSSL
jgi:hypothetical protein